MNAPVAPTQARPAAFRYSPMFPLGPRDTAWRKLDIAGVSTATCDGQTVLRIKPDALSELAFQAFHDVSHLLRPSHLRQLRAILDDPEASANDRFVALDLLKNASIAAGGVLPMCQDTGTALVFGKKGQRVWVEGDEEEALSWGVSRTYTETNLRYSQMAPLSMFEEVNTGNNLPVQFDIAAAPGNDHADEMNLMFIAKGGGSANKFFLFQETRAVLNPAKLLAYLDTKLKTLGTAACPPYHLAIVIGGTSCGTVPQDGQARFDQVAGHGCHGTGSAAGHAFRDLGDGAEGAGAEPAPSGIGAQFGGKYFCHDVRVIRLPRHGASPCPSASASRAAPTGRSRPRSRPTACSSSSSRPTRHKYLPEATDDILGAEVVRVDLNRSRWPRSCRTALRPPRSRRGVSLNGTMVVARDIAHAKLEGAAGRAARGLPALHQGSSGLLRRSRQDARRATPPAAFGPTTAGRMDSYVADFQARGRLARHAGQGQPLARGPRLLQAPMAASTSAASAAPPPAWRRTASARWRSWSIPSWAWKPSGRSRSRTSRPSS